ncbi:U-box domain-containing protein 25 [Linum perenne]
MRRLRGLARDSEKNQSVILNQNGQEIVLQVVFSRVDESIIHEALAVVALFPISEAEAVAADAVETLVNRLADFDNTDAECALATMELLCRIPSGCEALADHALTVPLLV